LPVVTRFEVGRDRTVELITAAVTGDFVVPGAA
jgi:hypothetical protein